MFSNIEEVFVVNGFVNKGDGNYEMPFVFKALDGYNIAIGSFPDND